MAMALLILGAVLLVSCSRPWDRPPLKRDESNLIKVPISQVFDDAEDNSFRFENKYADETLEVSGGTIISIESILDDEITVTLDDGRMNWCVCNIPLNPENKKAVDSLKLRDKITVVGVFDWENYKEGMITLEDCRLELSPITE